MNQAIAYRIAQIANLPILALCVVATAVSLFGLNRNEGIVFWAVLLAPVWLALWLGYANSIRSSQPSFSLAMWTIPPVTLVALLCVAMVRSQ